MSAAADVGIFFPQTIQLFCGFFLCGNIAGRQIFSMIDYILLIIHHKATGIPFDNISQRLEYFPVIQRNTEHSLPDLTIIYFPDCRDLTIIPVHDPLNRHIVL